MREGFVRHLKHLIIRHGLALACGLAVLAGNTAAAEPESLPGSGIAVTPGQLALDAENFQTLLVIKALERLGYEVKPVKQADYPALHLAVASGDVTFMADHWDQSHESYYQRAGGDARLWRENHYITGVIQGYLIDKKTADEYGITNIGQLRDPRLAALFDLDGDGKADLTGCPPGWFCEEAIEHQLTAWGLRKTVTHVEGNYSVMIGDVITRYRKGNPVLYFGWTPYWASNVLKPGHDVVWLEVPFSAMPNDKNANTELPNGRNYGFPVNEERVVANRKFIEQNPAAAALLSRMRLPASDISAQNQAMEKGANKPADVERQADGWIRAHQEQWDGWIRDALAAAR